MIYLSALQGCKSSILIYCVNAGKAKSAQLSDSMVMKLVSKISVTGRTLPRAYEMLAPS